ncbi:Radial spoke head 1-like [Symbiodinium microadriaticum]|uniref:Radial spoke head 1-like n=1 Tax=Symbiodinium microadriaticum TaxID=2951 RepID=A0A1Q9D984_SYMMI|nr:Radial spoke head 1-like [Symbiodinium microadriaticum]
MGFSIRYRRRHACKGSFRYGLRDGQGVLTLNAEGTDTYEGHFRAGHFDGYGTRQWANGCVYKGHWKQGRKHGEGTLIEPAGKSYRGQWHDGRRHGFGVLQLEGHSRYEGRWENGMQHGSGKYTDLRSETVLEGQWLCGAHHGRALLRSKGGARQRLQYNHGMLMHYQELPRPTVLPPVSKATGYLLTKKACGTFGKSGLLFVLALHFIPDLVAFLKMSRIGLLFEIDCVETRFGEVVRIVGDRPELGSWNPYDAETSGNLLCSTGEEVDENDDADGDN